MSEFFEKIDEFYTKITTFAPGYEILIPILVGIVVAWTVYIVLNFMYGDFIHKLKKANATDTESAKSFEELGVKAGKSLKKSLSKEGKGLRKCVDVTEDGKYYIQPKNEYRAFYDSRNTSPAAMFLQILFLVLLIALLLKAVPIIVEYFRDLELPKNDF